MFESWEHDEKLVVVKNPDHYDAKNVSIETVNFFVLVEESTALAMYENGELDTSEVPLGDMDRIKADPVLSKELYTPPVLCTYYYGFNTTKPPMDNALVRKALSAAVDRQKLVDTVTKGGQKPAKTLAPIGIFGSPALDPDFKGISFDPEQAKKWLAEAGYQNGEGWPEVTLMFNTSEGHQNIAEFMQQQWKEHLNINVNLANQEWKVFLKTVIEDAPQIFRNGWCADYPDENNWVREVFHSTESPNDIKWSNAEFDRLVVDAAKASDPEKRKELYFQAEKILCEDEAGIIPIYYYTTVRMSKPYLERGFNPMHKEHIDQWKVQAH